MDKCGIPEAEPIRFRPRLTAALVMIATSGILIKYFFLRESVRKVAITRALFASMI